MDFGVLIPNVNQIIKYPYHKVNKGDLGFFSVPIVQKSTPFTRLTTDSYWRLGVLSEGGIIESGRGGCGGSLGVIYFFLICLDSLGKLPCEFLTFGNLIL